MNDSFVRATPVAIATGFKAAGAVAAASIVKTVQAIEGLSEEKLMQSVKENQNKAMKLMAEITGRCDSPKLTQKKVKEEELIQNIMCKIINNKNVGNPYLSRETFATLASILNNYSDNNYIAFPKSVYEQEKQSARDAIFRSAAGTAAINAGTDAGFTALKNSTDAASKGFKNVMNPSVKQSTPGDAFISTIAVNAPIGIGVSVGLAAAAAEMFKTINATIPRQYIPDFNILVTAIAEKNKQIYEINIHYNECFETTIKNIISFLLKKTNIQSPFTYTLPITGKSISVSKAEFDETKLAFKSRSSTKVFIENEARDSCKQMFAGDFKRIETLKLEINEIKNIIYDFSKIFKFAPEKVADVAKEIAPLLTNLNLQKVDMVTINRINENILRIQQEQLNKPQKIDEPQKSSIISKISGININPFKKNGGRKSKTQPKKNKKKRTRRRR